MLRGCGLQTQGAIINFFAFYFLGIPLGISLALFVHMGTYGVWIGLACATTSQCIIYFIIILRMNWKKQSEKVSSSLIPFLSFDQMHSLFLFSDYISNMVPSRVRQKFDISHTMLHCINRIAWSANIITKYCLTVIKYYKIIMLLKKYCITAVCCINE